MMRTALAAALIAALPAQAADPAPEVRAMLARSIAFQTVEGRGQTAAYADYLAGELRAHGFAAEDITITPLADTAYLVARYRGTGAGKRKPILISGHMDVVDAVRADWKRDPFALTEENGFLYGRGVADMKGDLVTVVQAMIRLKRANFRPSRDVYLVLSGDEETTGATAQAIAARFKGVAEYVLITDAPSGALAPDNRTALYYGIQAGEKTYADFRIGFASPGGHSSEPTPDNAIYRLARAIDRIAAYQFPAQVNAITRLSVADTGKRVGGDLGAAMQRFARNPQDKAAAATISASPTYVGQIRTTCVATMLQAGHAPNALPQSAAVTVNCRIMPGVTVESVRDTLVRQIDDPTARIETLGSPLASDASPENPEITAAIRKALDLRYPGVPIVPEMAVGASDGVFFRAAGLPSYGASGLFIRPEDDFSHGLDERLPTHQIEGAIDYWQVMLRELAS